MIPDRRTTIQSMVAALGVACVQPPRGLGVGSLKPRIKIGQIGVSHAHANKLSVYRSSPDYEVVGIVEPNEVLREQAKSHAAFRDLRWMTREELFNVPGLQAVLVETSIRDLMENALACVRAGLHVHIDKPAGESLAALKAVQEIAKSKSMMVQIGYMYRYNPGVVLLREFLEKGWLGDIFEVHAVMSKTLSAPERRVPGEYPGGMMFELGCHIIDLVVGVLGAPDAVRPFLRHSSAINDALLDNALAVLEYPKALATVKTTCLEVNGGERRHIVVCGSQGTFQIQPLDNPAVRLTLSEKRGSYKTHYQEITLPKFTRYVDDAADMASVIRGEKEFGFTHKHDLAVQTVVLQASNLASSESNQSSSR